MLFWKDFGVTNGTQFGKPIHILQYFMHLYFYFSERVTTYGVVYANLARKADYSQCP